jgi:putative transposase
VKHLVDNQKYSERRACKLVGVCRSSVRYIPKPRRDEGPLIKRTKDLARQHKRYGYRRGFTGYGSLKDLPYL